MWEKAIDKQCKMSREASLPRLWCGLGTMALYRGRQPLFQFLIDFGISWKYIEGMINFCEGREKNAFHHRHSVRLFPLDLERLVLIIACQYDLRGARWKARFNNSWSIDSTTRQAALICWVKLCSKTLLYPLHCVPELYLTVYEGLINEGN